MVAAALARAAVAATVLAVLAAPAGAPGEGGRPWYAPDHGKLQLAGNIGFLSPGLGYAWGRRLEGDVFFGWVPEAIGGTDIFSVSGKLTWTPWSIDSRPWAFRPLTAALQLTYTFGDQYELFRPYFIPTALRSALALGADVSRQLGKRTVAIYGELVALDMGLIYWLSDSEALGPEDVFSVAVGVRIDF
jgi:hypothetical protein